MVNLCNGLKKYNKSLNLFCISVRAFPGHVLIQSGLSASIIDGKRAKLTSLTTRSSLPCPKLQIQLTALAKHFHFGEVGHRQWMDFVCRLYTLWSELIYFPMIHCSVFGSFSFISDADQYTWSAFSYPHHRCWFLSFSKLQMDNSLKRSYLSQREVQNSSQSLVSKYIFRYTEWGRNNKEANNNIISSKHLLLKKQ